MKILLVVSAAICGGLIASVAAPLVPGWKGNPMFIGLAVFTGLVDGSILGFLKAGAWEATILRDAHRGKKLAGLFALGFLTGLKFLGGVGQAHVLRAAIVNGMILALFGWFTIERNEVGYGEAKSDSNPFDGSGG
ncbi:MAG: hypothetical protein IT428_04030 [Planctomycetaceae bacterium]|nr:hypothetical protein [Planctomycetaceae bacterium]